MQCTWVFNRGNRKGQTCGVTIFKKTTGSFSEYCSKHRRNALASKNVEKANDIESIIQRHKEIKNVPDTEVYTEGTIFEEVDPSSESSSSDDGVPVNVETETNIAPLKEKSNPLPESQSDFDSSEDSMRTQYQGNEYADGDLEVEDIMDEDSEELEYKEKLKKKNKYKKFEKKKKKKPKKKKKEEPEEEEEEDDEMEESSSEEDVELNNRIKESLSHQADAHQQMMEYSEGLVTLGYTVCLHNLLSFRNHPMEVSERIAKSPLVKACIKSLCNKRKKMIPNPNKSPEMCLLITTGVEVAKEDPGFFTGVVNMSKPRPQPLPQPAPSQEQEKEGQQQEKKHFDIPVHPAFKDVNSNYVSV